MNDCRVSATIISLFIGYVRSDCWPVTVKFSS